MIRRTVLTGLSTLLGACSPLAAFNNLGPRDPARVGPLAIPYGDHPRQKLDLYRPHGRSGAPLPVLVFFYGGSWDSGRRQDYAWVGQALAAQGFLVAVPDYRLVPEVRYPGFVEDGARAVATVRRLAAENGGDPARLAVAGHSAGAYIASMVALDRRWLGALNEPPVSAFAGLAGPYDFYPFDVRASIEAFGRTPDPRMTQPVNLDLSAAPPAFLGHGGRDEVVRPRNSEALARGLRAAGREVELKVYPGMDHVDIVLALSRSFRGKGPVLADMIAFLRRQLAATG